MKGNFIIVGIIVTYLVIGVIASETGLTTPIVEPGTFIPDQPESGGSWIDKIATALAPIAWAFNAIAAVFQLATFQSTGVPPLVNSIVFVPIGLLLVFAGIKIVRGGGDS